VIANTGIYTCYYIRSLWYPTHRFFNINTHPNTPYQGYTSYTSATLVYIWHGCLLFLCFNEVPVLEKVLMNQYQCKILSWTSVWLDMCFKQSSTCKILTSVCLLRHCCCPYILIESGMPWFDHDSTAIFVTMLMSVWWFQNMAVNKKNYL